MKKKVPFVRVPLPTFEEGALKERCQLCGLAPGVNQWHTLKAGFDNLQVVSFLIVYCLRCGGIVDRYAPLKKKP